MSPTPPSAPTAPHLLTGKRGERTAALYIRGLGWRMHAMNRRIGEHDEIDLVALDPAENVMVFIEVKTRARKSDDYVPELNITFKKRSRMARAAREWMHEYDEEIGYRMDVVCVAGGKVTEHYRDIEWE